jgi:transcriptional regulator with XRE-family HTH domain
VRIWRDKVLASSRVLRYGGKQMHPLKVACAAAGLTQYELADRINALKWKRGNGKPLRLTAGYLSQLCTEYRRPGRLVARAIAEVLGRPELASMLVFAGDSTGKAA